MDGSVGMACGACHSASMELPPDRRILVEGRGSGTDVMQMREIQRVPLGAAAKRDVFEREVEGAFLVFLPLPLRGSPRTDAKLC